MLPTFSAPEWVDLANDGGLSPDSTLSLFALLRSSSLLHNTVSSHLLLTGLLRGSPAGARFELACAIVHRITTAVADFHGEE